MSYHTPIQPPEFMSHSPYVMVGGQSYTNNPYAPGNVQFFGSPPMPGSLGTPHIGSTMWRRNNNSGNSNNNNNQNGGGRPNSGHRGSHEGPNSWRRSKKSTPSAKANIDDAAASGLVLVPTRPLLKILARECRPFPPWCVGMPMPKTLTDEIRAFAQFLRTSVEENAMFASSIEQIIKILRGVWPAAELRPMGSQCAGLPHLKDFSNHFYAIHSTEEGVSLEESKEKLRDIANDNGAQVEFLVDNRGIPCALISDIRSSLRFAIRYGPEVTKCEAAAEVLQEAFTGKDDFIATFLVLDALLRQNKAIDDTGANHGDLSGEATAIMLLAIINSYPAGDVPDAGRLLIDFFLTYGFQPHFDAGTSSVSYKGIAPPVAKVHRNAQISILDPSDETQNLTPKLDKVSHLQAVFNYCYTAITQFTQVNANQRRAQSALSTIIGGESYWSRVLQLYHEEVEPYFHVVRDKRKALAAAL